jgi:hypothetical protein
MVAVRLKDVRRLGWWKERKNSLPRLGKRNDSVRIYKLNNGWHRVSVSSLWQTQLHIERLHVILCIHSGLHRELPGLLAVRIRLLSNCCSCVLYLVTISVHIELNYNTVLSTITWITNCYRHNVVESKTLLVHTLHSSAGCRSASRLLLGLCCSTSMKSSHLFIVMFCLR